MSRHLAWIYRSFGTVAKIHTACCGKLPVSHCVDESYVLRHPPTLLRSQADTQTIGLHHLRGSKCDGTRHPTNVLVILLTIQLFWIWSVPQFLDIENAFTMIAWQVAGAFLTVLVNRDRFYPRFNRRVSSVFYAYQGIFIPNFASSFIHLLVRWICWHV
jgi:hypothetical protein